MLVSNQQLNSPMASPKQIVLSASAVAIAIASLLLLHSQTNSDPTANQRSKTTAAASTATTVKAFAKGTAQPLSPNLMCFNVESVQISSWESPEFLAAANQLRPKVLRIPGGEVANYWDWQRGGIITDERIAEEALPDGLPEYMRYEARDYTSSKLSDYKAGLYATNSQALFVLNMLTSDLSEQIDMLSAAAKAGIEIKYIELGNEYFFGIPNYADKFPTPAAYGEEAKVWIKYLRDIFPGVEIAVFGVVPAADSSQRESSWNQALLETALPEADAITLHIYSKTGLDPNGFSNQGYPAFDESNFSTIFSEPFKLWAQLRDRPQYQLIPNDKEIWITEFNLIEDIFGNNASRLPRVMGTWGHGLYALSMNLMFLEDERITLTCNHDLVEDFKFGAILPREDSFKITPERSFPVVPMSLSASGQALQMVAEAADGMTLASPLEFSAQPPLEGTAEGTQSPALYGWQFARSPAIEAATDAETRSIVLNLSPQIIELAADELADRAATYQQLSADPRTLVTGPDQLRTSSGSLESAIALPPHSVTLIDSTNR